MGNEALVPSVGTSAPRSGTPDFLSAFQSQETGTDTQGDAGASGQLSSSIPGARDDRENQEDQGAGRDDVTASGGSEPADGTDPADQAGTSAGENAAAASASSASAKPAKKTAAKPKQSKSKKTETVSTGALTPPGAEYEALEKTTVYLAPTVLEAADDARMAFIKENRPWVRAHGKPSNGAWLTMLLSAGMEHLDMDLEATLRLLPPDGRRVRHQAEDE